MVLRIAHFIAAALLLYGETLFGQSQMKLDRPNIILILADDLGYADLSMNGSKQIHTPNIDLLAKSGVNFTQSYVSSAVCSPSRAGILTGINQVEYGYDNNLSTNTTGFDPEFAGLPVNIKTIATLLKEQGYTTGLVGKWHLGHKEQFHPLNRGFDEFWGYVGGGHDYFETEEGNIGRRAPIECNYKEPQALTYITDDKGDECIDFIKRNKDQPFFLYASFNAPHAPMQALDADLELYKDIEDIGRRTYAAMVHRLDVNVGRMIESLDDEGIRNNTLVILLSDNGGPTDQNFSCNAPYNGQKGILLEGGIRVPLIASWPGTLSQDIQYTNPVSSLDLAPTFLKLAGGNIDSIKFSGVDLMPYLKSQLNTKPHETMMWKFTISTAIREGDWKLISIPDRLPMLFNLATDISEKKNVALERLDITKRLMKKMGAWEVKLAHPIFLEGAEWKKKQLDLYDVDYNLVQPY